MRRHWFLPETPDVVGMLRRQVAGDDRGHGCICRLGGRGCGGGRAASRGPAGGGCGEAGPLERPAGGVRDAARAGGRLHALARHRPDHRPCARPGGRGRGHGEPARFGRRPDGAAAGRRRFGHIDEAIAHLGSDSDAATEAADAALDDRTGIAQAYYQGMAALLEVEDMRERISRRELYRRCARIGEGVVDVAERIQYAIVKQI